jgi:hypothetical protein
MVAKHLTETKQQHSEQSRSRRQGAVPTGKKGRVRRKASASCDASTLAESQVEQSSVCVNCSGELLFVDETRLCPKCNSEASITMIKELSAVVMERAELDSGFIECPGATLFDQKTGEPLEGAVFGDDTGERNTDDSYTVKHVKWPVYPPGHMKRRMIPTEAYGKIRRCRACQDYTVRMRRREGADFCAPSAKFPHRKRLKSVDLVSHRQTI